MVQNNENKTGYRSLEVIFEEVRRRLESQRESTDSLNTRAGLILGLSALILTSSMSFGELGSQSVWLKVLLLIFTFGAAGFSLLGYMIAKYRVDPEPRPLVENYLKDHEFSTKKQILDNWVDSYEENRRKILRKAKYVIVSLASLMMAFVVLAVIYVSLFIQSR